MVLLPQLKEELIRPALKEVILKNHKDLMLMFHLTLKAKKRNKKFPKLKKPAVKLTNLVANQLPMKKPKKTLVNHSTCSHMTIL